MGVMVWYCHGGYNGSDVLDLERPCWFFFFFPLSVLVPEVEGERRKGKEREREK